MRLRVRAIAGTAVLVLTFAGHAVAEPDDDARGSNDAATVEQWVGHQVTLGHRDIPVLGGVDTRSDTWVLADVRRVGSRIELTERPCRVRLAETAGARVTLPDTGVRALPVTVVRYLRQASDGSWRAGPWSAGWNAGDHDRDGHPGLTVEVDAPLCGGRLYLASRATSLARATTWGQALRGELKVKLAQTILGAEGACLSVISSDSDERLSGRVAYAPVPAGSSCASLERAGWLDRHLADERSPP